MKIWTYGYRPFTMGGNVHPPVCCEVEPVSGVIELGKGYQGVVVLSPSTKTYIVEVITGGIVGDSVSDVMKDIAEGDEVVMAKQIQDNLKVAERAIPVTSTEFWRFLK